MAVATASALFLSACGFGGAGEDTGLAPGDYTVARQGDVTKSIIVNGNISPIRAVSLSSPVQAKVKRIAVATGDRVEVDQLLAEIDTDMLERELSKQEKQQASAQAEAMVAVEQAEAQLNVVQDQINRGVHPGISQAQANLDQAQASYDAVVSGQVPPEMGGSVNEAYAVLQDAFAQLDVAKSQVILERDQLQAQVDSAWRQAEAAGNAESDEALELQINSGTLYAPIPGVVTNVDAYEGDVPEGRILAIADDSRMLIHSEVRESDVASIAPGNRVKFTSTATGRKEFTGKVNKVSPAGAPSQVSAQPQGGGQQGTSSDVMFPVEIEVTGDKEGLRLGGSVRAEIITEEEPDALSVPLDAVFEDNGAKKVLVLRTDGDEGREGTVEERTVKTGAENEVDIAVTGGDLEPGDTVLNWPDEYKARVGEKVSIVDPNFHADKQTSASEGSNSGAK